MKDTKTDFIMDKFEIEESDKRNVYVPGEAKNMIIGGRDSGNVFILSLDDDIRDRIAEALSEKLERKLLKIGRDGGTPAITEAAENDNQVVSLPRGAALAEKNREMLQTNGKVLFIMCDFMALLKATDGSEDARTEVTNLINRFEPHFMNSAHHIIRSDQSFDEMVQDALEKISL